jgi:hypothetical protein
MSITFGNEFSSIPSSSLTILLNNLFYNPAVALVLVGSSSGLAHSSSHGYGRIDFPSSPCQNSEGKYGGRQCLIFGDRKYGGCRFITPLQLSPFVYQLLPFKVFLAPRKHTYRLLPFEFLLAPGKPSPHSNRQGHPSHLTCRGIGKVWEYLPGNPRMPPRGGYHGIFQQRRP